jgi:hypothetical protein
MGRTVVNKDDVFKYVEIALCLPVENREQIVSMVILHFDIPDKEAKQIVDDSLQKLRSKAAHLLYLLDRLGK